MNDKIGNPMGSGNPPGQYSKSYTASMTNEGNFNEGKSYRGDMHVGINNSATEVGNQPKDEKSSGLMNNKEDSLR